MSSCYLLSRKLLLCIQKQVTCEHMLLEYVCNTDSASPTHTLIQNRTLHMGRAVIIRHAELLPSAGTEHHIFLSSLKKSPHLSPVVFLPREIKSRGWSGRSLNIARLDRVILV